MSGDKSRWDELLDAARQADVDRRYDEAERLYEAAAREAEAAFGRHDERVLRALRSLQGMLQESGRHASKEAVSRRILALRAEELGPDHPDLAAELLIVAYSCWSQGKLAEAEEAFRRALEIREKAFGPDHSEVAFPLHSLAGFLRSQGRHAESEALLLRLIAIAERDERLQATYLLPTLMQLAYSYQDQARHAEAEVALRKLVGLQRQHEPESFQLPLCLYQLAQACRAQGKLAEAESAYREALETYEHSSTRWPEELRAGSEQWRVRVLNDYANLLRRLGRWAESEQLYLRALAVADHATEPAPESGSPLADEASALELRAALLRDYARLLHRIGRQAEAADLDARADVAGAEAQAKRRAFEAQEGVARPASDVPPRDGGDASP